MIDLNLLNILSFALQKKQNYPVNWFSLRAHHLQHAATYILADLFQDRISHERDSRGSAMSNHKKLILRPCVTESELPFFHKRNRSVCKNAVT